MPPRLVSPASSEHDGSGHERSDVVSEGSEHGSAAVVGELGGLSDYDVEILHNIITRAEIDPSIHLLPFKALFKAYDDVLAQRGISKESDRVWLRCLFKVGEKNDRKNPGTLIERFERLLGGLGIVLDYESDEWEERLERHAQNEEEAENIGGFEREERTGIEKSDMETPTDARGVLGFGTPTPTDRSRKWKRRRASFNSMYDFTATGDFTREPQKRPSSRSSVSRLQVGKSPFRPKSRKNVPRPLERTGSPVRRPQVQTLPGQRRRVSDAGAPGDLARKQRQDALEIRQQALRNWHPLPAEKATQAGSGRLPSPNVPGGFNDDSSVDAPTSTTLDVESPFRKVSVPSPQRLRAAAARPPQDVRHPAPPQPALLSPFQQPRQSSHLDRLRQAQEKRAIQHDKSNLLWDAFSRWLRLARSRRREHIYAELEERVIERRNLNVMYRALDSWIIAAAEQQSRTALARRHMLRTKYFKLWREHTRATEVKVQRFALVKPLNAWRTNYIRLWANEVTAMHMYRDNLIKRHFWTWFWKYCDVNAERQLDVKLQQNVLAKWQKSWMEMRQRMRNAETHDERRLKISALRKWSKTMGNDSTLERQADEFRKRKLLRRYTTAWRKEAELAPLAARVSNMIDWRIARATSATWILRTRMARRAAEWDRQRLLRSKWTTWNDRLRWQTLEARINERLMAESMYKWVLMSRFNLMKRVHDRRVQQQTLEKAVVGFRKFRGRLEEREAQLEETRNRHLTATALDLFKDKLQALRQQENRFLDFYSPKIEREFLGALKARHKHIQWMEGRAREKESTSLKKWILKSWMEAVTEARRLKRRDAYAQIRRKVKMNLATLAIEKWHIRMEQIRQSEDRAQGQYNDKITDLGVVVLKQWRDRIVELQEDDEKAESHYNTTLLNRSLRAWSAQLQQLRDLEAQHYQFSRIQVLSTSAPLLRKLRFRLFEIRSRQDMADSMKERNHKNHVRNIIRHWRGQLISPTPLPASDFTRSTNFATTPQPGNSDPINAGSNTPSGRPPGNWDWTNFGEPFDASDWIPALEAQSSLTPLPVPAYLNTPSKRSVRAKALAQMSTTPVTPLRTPFSNRPRSQIGSASGGRTGTQRRGAVLGQSRLGFGDVRTVDEEETVPGEEDGNDPGG